MLLPSPLVGCSIGLVYKKQPVVGVINMPFLNQLVGSTEALVKVKKPDEGMHAVLRETGRGSIYERDESLTAYRRTSAIDHPQGMYDRF